MQALTQRATVVATAAQVWCDLGTAAAILHFSSGSYYGLDAVGARVWALVQRPVSVAELHATLLAEYDVAPDRLADDLLALLDRLHAADLIEVRDGVAA